LRTYLQDPLVSANKIDQHAAFVNPQREWFLGVDVLAGKAGVDTGQHALKRLGGHDDGIDVLALQELAMVLVDGPVSALVLSESLGQRQIAIAKGDNPACFGELFHQQGGTMTDADGAHADAVVRTGFSAAPEDGARDKHWRGHTRRGADEGVATRNGSTCSCHRRLRILFLNCNTPS